MLKIINNLIVLTLININTNYIFKDKNGNCCYRITEFSNTIQYNKLKNVYKVNNYWVYIKNNYNVAFIYNNNHKSVSNYKYKAYGMISNIIYFISSDDEIMFFNGIEFLYLNNKEKDLIILINNYFINNKILYRIDRRNLIKKEKIMNNFLISTNNKTIVFKNENHTFINFLYTSYKEYKIEINFDKILKFIGNLFVIKNNNTFDLISLNHLKNKKIVVLENIIVEKLILINDLIFIYKDLIFLKKPGIINNSYLEYENKIKNVIGFNVIYYNYIEIIFENKKVLLFIDNLYINYIKIYWNIKIDNDKTDTLIWFFNNKLVILKYNMVIESDKKFIKMYNIGLYLFIYYKSEDKILLIIYNLNVYRREIIKNKIEFELEKYEEFNIYNGLIISNNYLLNFPILYYHNLNINYVENKFNLNINYNSLNKYFEKYNNLIKMNNNLLNLNKNYKNKIDELNIKMKNKNKNLDSISSEYFDIKFMMNKIENKNIEIKNNIEKNKINLKRFKFYYYSSIFILIIAVIFTSLMIFFKFIIFKELFY